MKLYDLDQGSVIHCEVSDGSEFITFDHVDGIYSFSISEKGNPIHITATAPVRKVGDHYEIDE